MDTNQLRSIVKTAATATRGAKLWPNGLGFDARGTQYVYLEATGEWHASRPYGLAALKSGYGKTPEAAKRAAGIGGRSVNSRGGAA